MPQSILGTSIWPQRVLNTDLASEGAEIQLEDLRKKGMHTATFSLVCDTQGAADRRDQQAVDDGDKVLEPETGIGRRKRRWSWPCVCRWTSMENNRSGVCGGRYGQGGSTNVKGESLALSSGRGSMPSETRRRCRPTPSGFFYKYELKDEIGVGKHVEMFQVREKADGMVFACKVIDKSNIEAKFTGLLAQFLTEIKVLKMLLPSREHHPFGGPL